MFQAPENGGNLVEILIIWEVIEQLLKRTETALQPAENVSKPEKIAN